MGKTLRRIRAAVIQLNSIDDKASNLLQAEHWVTRACEEIQPNLIALPEMFAFMGGDISQKKAAAEVLDNNDVAISLLRKLANKYKCYIHGGSICEVDSGKFFNTTCVIDPHGQMIAKYRKINLFSFTTTSKTRYNESALLSPGNKIVTYRINKFAIGCAICFDIRFGQLFQRLIAKHVNVIIIPCAFTCETGEAHWEILCRARAIETQSYILAPAQTKTYLERGQKRACYGHSMIIDPWGKILAQLEEEVGFIYADLDLDFLYQARARLPCL